VAKNNMTSVLWIDPSERMSAAEVRLFNEQGMAISQADSASLSDDDFIGAQVVVVSLDRCTGLLAEVQSRQAGCDTSAPVVARVHSDQFELGIQAMSQGAFTVVPAQEKDAAVWYQKTSSLLIPEKSDQPAFVFVDPVSRNLLALTERVAQVDVTVLLTGPTGVGKEVLARIVHDASPRYEGPFIAFNCAAMPENLIEDMLFGHEKGSFTGATKVQPGLFEQAQGVPSF